MEFQQTNQQVIFDHLKNREQMADRVEITFYTDPLCCWGWAFEPQWRRLQYKYDGLLTCRYVMSGLLPTWQSFNDPLYSVSRPMQMGPVWHEASLMSGMKIYDKIWVEDPPASSYPACIAVKCAELQSHQAGVLYLRLAREAVMLHGKNIAKQNVLKDIANDVSQSSPGLLDMEKFLFDLMASDNGIEAFRKDLNEVQARNISRFPTLIMRSLNKPSLMITGYRPYPVLVDAMKQLTSEHNLKPKVISKEDYVKYWGQITDREIEEIFT